MMDLEVPTRAWKTYRVDDVEKEFGQDEFRSSAKRARLNRGMSEHVEKKHEETRESEETASEAPVTRI